jgi:ABC-type Na+ efflux pump permease subunit
MSFLRPLFALFVRSLREQSRTKYTSIARAAVVLIVLLIIASNEQNFVNRSAPGLTVLITLAMVNFFTITIFGLSTFPSAITEEKEEDTLGLLRMTQLNPLSILLGKSTARLFDGFLLLSVQVPFMMLCVTLGGVQQSQILRTYGILAAYLFLLCNVGLLWSVICRRSKGAASMTTLTGIALYILPSFLMSVVFATRLRSTFAGQAPVRPWHQAFSEWIFSINPLFDLMKTVFPRGSGFPFATNSIVPGLVIGAVCFGLAWLLFGPCCNTTGEAVPRREPKAGGSASRRRIVFGRPGRFAIAWKDFHFLNGGWRGIVIRLLVYAGICGLFVLWISKIGFRSRASIRDIGEVLRTTGVIIFTAELGLTAARIFGVERKRKTLGSLFTLPSGTTGLVWQKVLGCLPLFIPSLGMIVLGFVFLYVASSPEDWRYRRLMDGEFLTFLVASYCLLAVLAAYLSLRLRRAALSSALMLMFFGYMFAGALFSSVLRSGVAAAIVIAFFTLFIAPGIPRRIAAAAAEE